MKKENYEFVRYITNDNDARWADADEIKNDPTLTQINVEGDDCQGCGIPLISDGRSAYVDSSDTHTLVFGSTGSKKTRLFGMPLINFFAMAGESFIATDPKGELYAKTSGLVDSKGYKTVVLNFRDLGQSDFWNPLKWPYEVYHSGKRDEAVLLLNDFLGTLAAPQRERTRDPYFIDLGYSMALAYLLFFIETASPDEINVFNFANFFGSNPTSDAAEKMQQCVAEGSIASVNLKGVLTNKNVEKTFANVASCVSVMLQPFLIQKELCKILSASSFDIRDIGKEKTAIYIIVPDEKTTFHFLITSFIKQVYEALIHEAQKQEDKKLPVRVNFLLDEFCNIPTIPDMAAMVTAARSRNMRFFLMVQGMSQMKEKYGNSAETIKGNCDNWVFLTSREYDLLEQISNLCGMFLYTNHDGKVESRPLISVSELQRLKKERGEVLIFHGRNYPFVTELPDIDDYHFKKYKPIERKEKEFPKIKQYDFVSITDDIIAKKLPLAFCMEVFKEVRYGDFSNTKKNDIFDW